MNAAAMGVMVARVLACCRQQLGLHGRVVAAELTFKGEEIQAEHVEGGHPGGEEAHQPEDGEAVEGLAENFVLAPEPCQGGDAADRDTANEEGDGRHRHLLAQTTHQPHVLGKDRFVADHLFHGMDD